MTIASGSTILADDLTNAFASKVGFGDDVSACVALAPGATTRQSLAFLAGRYATDVQAFGATGNGSTDDSTAVAAACAASNRYVFFPGGAGTVYSIPNMTALQAASTIWIGEGATVSGASFRKQVARWDSPSIPAPDQDIIPSLHLRNLGARLGTKLVIFAGDSVASVTSNGVSPASSAVALIADQIKRHNPLATFNFQIQSVGGATWTTLNTTQASGQPFWTTYGFNGSLSWAQNIVAAAPALVVFVVSGNNDGSTFPMSDFLSVMSAMSGIACDVVFAIDSPKSIQSYNDTTMAAGADHSNGFLRTYAKAHGIGLIDAHRRGAMIRDGIDPASTVLMRDTLSADDAGVMLPHTMLPTYDLGFLIYQWGTAGQPAFATTGELQIQIGNDTGNVFRIGRDSGTGNVYYKVDTTSSRNYIPKTVTTYPAVFDSGGRIYAPFSVRGDQVYAYWQDDSKPIFIGTVERFGGKYAPVISCASGAVSQFIGTPMISDTRPSYLPSLTDFDMWGTATDGSGPYGGNGGVHQTTINGELVWRPVVHAQNFAVPQRGTWTPALSFGSASVGITYTTQTGTWTINGNLVTLNGYILLSSKGTSTGTAQITLPFNVATAYGDALIPQYFANFSGFTGAPSVWVGTSSILLLTPTGSFLTDANFGNATAIKFSGTYQLYT